MKPTQSYIYIFLFFVLKRMALPLSRCLGVCNFKHVKSILLQYCYHALIQKSNSDIDVLCATVTRQSFKSLRSTVNSLLATIRAMQAQIDILNSKYCCNVIYHLYVQTKLDCIYIYTSMCMLLLYNGNLLPYTFVLSLFPSDTYSLLNPLVVY